MAGTPHRWRFQSRVQQVAVPADERVDPLTACEGDQVVILAISSGDRLIGWIDRDRRVTPNPLYELPACAGIGVARELGPLEDPLQLAEER